MRQQTDKAAQKKFTPAPIPNATTTQTTPMRPSNATSVTNATSQSTLGLHRTLCPGAWYAG
eukprot:12422571-Karenia_brevis.AAC.1